MRQRTAGFQLVVLIGLVIGLVIGLGLLLSAPALALAEPVPFNCVILPGDDIASIMMTNVLDRDASCIVTCKFQTTKYDNNPQITCAKPIPAGKEVEMCGLSSGADKMVRLTAGHAECTK